MYDTAKRKQFFNATVADVISELSKLLENAILHCCGDNLFWLHVEQDGSAVCIDTENLEDCYDC